VAPCRYRAYSCASSRKALKWGTCHTRHRASVCCGNFICVWLDALCGPYPGRDSRNGGGGGNARPRRPFACFLLSWPGDSLYSCGRFFERILVVVQGGQGISPSGGSRERSLASRRWHVDFYGQIVADFLAADFSESRRVIDE